MSFRNSINNTHECYTLKEKITQAENLGIVLIAAAGNDGKATDKYLPASHSSVITVSATDESNAPASFSNYGSAVDIAAPGVNIKSPTPRQLSEYNDENIIPAYNAYTIDDGTSYSAPLVAAAAATLKSIDPDITPAEVKRIIKETAYVPENWDKTCEGKNYGAGIVNFYNMVKAVLEPEYSGTPTIKANSDSKFEITAPEGTDSRIYYTLDGTVPTLDNHLTYTEPVNLKNTYAKKITAVCHENGKFIGEPVVYDMITYDTKTIFCKWSDTLPVKDSTEAIDWQSYNSEIVSVDDSGKITGVSKGTTRITCTLATGERVIWNVNVKYSPIQAFFVMFFFGFLWI